MPGIGDPAAAPQTRTEEVRRAWPVLLGAVIGVGVGISSLPFYTFGVFLKELEESFGWSRTQLSMGQFVYLLGLAIASPFVGRMVDRYGVRLPLTVSLACLALCFAALGAVMNSLAAFLLIHGAMAMLAAASSPLAYTRVVNAWFDKARGLALGLTLMGTGLAATFGPAFVSSVIGRSGWRGGYLALAGVVFIAMPLVLWLVRRPPNDVVAPASAISTVSADFSGSLRSRTFWQLSLIFSLLALAITGLVGHFVPMLTDAGVGRAEAAALAGVIGIAVISGRLLVGLLVDYLFAPYVAAAVLTVSALACVSFALYGPPLAAFAAFGIGFAVGAEVDLISYLVARYFGLAAYGRIYGIQYGAFILGTGLSPVWIAAVFDRTGFYTPALFTSAAAVGLVVVLCLALPAFPASADARNPLTSAAPTGGGRSR